MKHLVIFLCFGLLMAMPYSYKANAQQADVVVQMGHPQNIYTMAFSPDEEYIVTGSIDKTLRLWEIKTGKEVRTFSGHRKDQLSDILT
jgi:WD40 repeat protein